jgi:hypothetical protein
VVIDEQDQVVYQKAFAERSANGDPPLGLYYLQQWSP